MFLRRVSKLMCFRERAFVTEFVENADGSILGKRSPSKEIALV